MSSFLSLSYSVFAYLLFFATFLYAVAFLGDLGVAKSVDSGVPGPLMESVAIDLMLLGVFAVQHSVMARRGFKQWWTRIVPPVAERSTYVLAATAALALVMWQWRPIPAPVIWHVEGHAATAIWAVFVLGWVVLLFSSFLINHFELFGLRQPVLRILGHAPAEPKFRTPLLYRYVRHPLYLGFLLGFWATPHMSAGHLLFALGATGYILVGIWFEERDLVAQFGDRYRDYRAQVGMLLPSRRSR